MRCHKCNQDSIKITMEEKEIHIKCDICPLDIHCKDNQLLLCDLFLYNENLEEAELLGQEAYNDNNKLEDNPYSSDSNQILLNNKWELGYKREKYSYEYSALFLSSEKIKEQLEQDIKQLEKEKSKELRHEKQEREREASKITAFILLNYEYIDKFCYNLLRIPVLGRLLKNHVKIFKKQYEDFCRWYYPRK